MLMVAASIKIKYGWLLKGRQGTLSAYSMSVFPEFWSTTGQKHKPSALLGVKLQAASRSAMPFRVNAAFVYYPPSHTSVTISPSFFSWGITTRLNTFRVTYEKQYRKNKIDTFLSWTWKLMERVNTQIKERETNEEQSRITFRVTMWPSSSVNCSSVTDSPGMFFASSP